MANIIITSDSTTDLSAELKERYNIKTIPLGVNLGDKTYFDGIDITPDDIYAHHSKTGELPKTTAANMSDCIDFFQKFVDEGKTIDGIILDMNMPKEPQTEPIRKEGENVLRKFLYKKINITYNIPYKVG